MKSLLLAALVIIPQFSLAKSTEMSGADAATLVRQGQVEKCLAVVENNNRGSASFESISLLSNDTSGAKYSLKGSIASGDALSGNFEIIVSGTLRGEEVIYSCEVVTNEESAVVLDSEI